MSKFQDICLFPFPQYLCGFTVCAALATLYFQNRDAKRARKQLEEGSTSDIGRSDSVTSKVEKEIDEE